MNVTISYCTICFGYRDRALAVAEELQRRFDANVEVIGGKVGQFDVEIDGELVVSRGRTFLARMKPSLPPKIAEAIAAVERHLASGE
ncbi:MAG: Rdx family protein [Steroidobacteraceae bacterium]